MGLKNKKSFEKRIKAETKWKLEEHLGFLLACWVSCPLTCLTSPCVSVGEGGGGEKGIRMMYGVLEEGSAEKEGPQTLQHPWGLSWQVQTELWQPADCSYCSCSVDGWRIWGKQGEDNLNMNCDKTVSLFQFKDVNSARVERGGCALIFFIIINRKPSILTSFWTGLSFFLAPEDLLISQLVGRVRGFV